MPSDPDCLIQIEVNAGRRLVEGKGGLIELRFTNLSPDEAFSFEVTVQASLLSFAWSGEERLGPSAQLTELMSVDRVAAVNAALFDLRAVVQEANGGRHLFAGGFALDVEASADGPSVVNYHVNVSATDGGVVDAERMQIGGRQVPKQDAVGWRRIPMHAESEGDTLARCVLVDEIRQSRLVVDARRAIVIGRDGGDADLTLIDPHRKISRAHCRLCVDEGGARLEHLSRTNTTRMNGTEVADSTPVSLNEPAEVVLAGDLKLRLKPVPSAVLSQKSARTILGGGSGLRGIPRPDGSSVGGCVIEAIEPAGAGPYTLWLFGAVRARDVLPRLGDDSLILASVPHLVRGLLSSTGDVSGTRSLRAKERLAGWLVVG